MCMHVKCNLSWMKIYSISIRAAFDTVDESL